MLSLENIINILEPKQLELPIRNLNENNIIKHNNLYKNNYNFLKTEKLKSLYETFLNVNDFKLYKIKSYNSFIKSILCCLNSEFLYKTDDELNEYINELINIMRISLEKNEDNKIFGYNKKKINKASILKILSGLKKNYDSEEFNVIKQYFVDYFNINVYVIIVDNETNSYLSNEKYLFLNYKQEYPKFLNILLEYNNNQYYPIIHNKNSILTLKDNIDILLKLDDIFDLNISKYSTKDKFNIYFSNYHCNNNDEDNNDEDNNDDENNDDENNDENNNDENNNYLDNNDEDNNHENNDEHNNDEDNNHEDNNDEDNNDGNNNDEHNNENKNFDGLFENKIEEEYKDYKEYKEYKDDDLYDSKKINFEETKININLIDKNKLSKMKIIDIKSIALKLDIDLLIKSEKTNKKINKKKDLLIEEILKKKNL